MENPSALEMRIAVAHDAQTGRYTREVLLEIMRCIERVQEQEDNVSLNSVEYPAVNSDYMTESEERLTPELIPLLSHT